VKCLTEGVTDVGPLLLFLQNALQFRADVHVIHVIQEGLHHLPSQVHHPRHANELAKLENTCKEECIIRPHVLFEGIQ